MPWDRLIRFVGEDDTIYRGEPIMEDPNVDLGKVDNLTARVIEGADIFDDYTVSDKVLKVKRLLGPLTPDEVPIVRCLALNYIKHIQETGSTVPSIPVMFIKPRTAVADHGEHIPIPKIAQTDQCDYEGELCVVISKSGKDISLEQAMDYIGGYTVGNDMSARGVQQQSSQLCFSKGFDKYCPLGPVLVAPHLIEDAGNLKVETRVNGNVRQDSNTNDFLFSIAEQISYLSQGTTLEKGTVIMTGTPGGVGMGFKPPKFLQNRDKVEVTVEKIGTLTNVMNFL
jgi:2-keto-4-pentenoate hydratase/2-oxohepta-3-ene-1,7-dioic acid hydratase in catechol pathway